MRSARSSTDARALYLLERHGRERRVVVRYLSAVRQAIDATT